MSLDDEIKQALEENIDLSEEEYQKLQEKADAQTERHGVKGTAPVSESRRHKRLQSNYYGISIKILMNILASLDTIVEQQENIVKILGDMNNGKRVDE